RGHFVHDNPQLVDQPPEAVDILFGIGPVSLPPLVKEFWGFKAVLAEWELNRFSDLDRHPQITQDRSRSTQLSKRRRAVALAPEIQEHIGRFDVSVSAASLMEEVQRLGNIRKQANSDFDR